MMGGGQGTGSSDQDARICSLYQRLGEQLEPRYAAGYDLERGLGRYQVWLRVHTAQPAGQEDRRRRKHAAGPRPRAADGDLQAAVTETLVAVAETVADGFPALPEWSTQRAVIELYAQHYRSLVRLAALLVRDTPTAEEVVQDAFVALDGGWGRLKDTDKALAYLRQAVVNRSRSVLRHRTVVDKNLQKAPPDMPSAEHGALVLLERSAVVAALRGLPERQREAIVLRYYADLSEAEIAATMGITRGAVKSHTARGMAALRTALEQG